VLDWDSGTGKSYVIPAAEIVGFIAALNAFNRIDDPETSSYLQPPEFLSGGGGLVGTAADYLRFCTMLLNRGELDGAQYVSFFRGLIDLVPDAHVRALAIPRVTADGGVVMCELAGHDPTGGYVDSRFVIVGVFGKLLPLPVIPALPHGGEASSSALA